MKMFLHKLYALVKKDFQEELSYRLNFFLHLASVLMFATAFFYVARIFGGAHTVAEPLRKYNGDYFSFVLIGLAFTGYMNTGLSAFSGAIRTEQMLGTLEFILTTPTQLWVILFAKILFNFIYDSFYLIIYFVFGMVFLRAQFGGANIAALPLILLLSLASFNALGMLSAGFILVFKKGDPVNVFFSMLSVLLGGVYYPIEVLPAAMQKAAAFIPITYTLRLSRDACINGASFTELAPDFIKLALLCLALVPAGVIFISWSLRRAKSDGSLTHY